MTISGTAWKDEYVLDCLGKDVQSLKVFTNGKKVCLVHQPSKTYKSIILSALGLQREVKDLELNNNNMMVNGYSQQIQGVNQTVSIPEFNQYSKQYKQLLL